MQSLLHPLKTICLFCACCWRGRIGSYFPVFSLHELMSTLKGEDHDTMNSYLGRRWSHVWCFHPSIGNQAPGAHVPAFLFPLTRMNSLNTVRPLKVLSKVGQGNSALHFCIHICKVFGDPRGKWAVTLYYHPDHQHTLKRCWGVILVHSGLVNNPAISLGWANSYETGSFCLKFPLEWLDSTSRSSHFCHKRKQKLFRRSRTCCFIVACFHFWGNLWLWAAAVSCTSL